MGLVGDRADFKYNGHDVDDDDEISQLVKREKQKCVKKVSLMELILKNK